MWSRLGWETASLENEVASVEMCRWLAFVHLWLLCCKGEVACLVRISLLLKYVYNDFISNNGKGQSDPPLLQMNQALYTSLNSCIFQIKGVDILINDSLGRNTEGAFAKFPSTVLGYGRISWGKKDEGYLKQKQWNVQYSRLKPKCLASHSPAIEYSAGQEVRIQPERERERSKQQPPPRKSLVTLEIGSLRTPQSLQECWDPFCDDLS